ncbi:MAG TPA: hypothetical protein VGT41_02785 [Candidatus Babeliales bacterium]|nr:hypothetical protein [Candidatus Babeliales bacterium]
MKETIFYRLLAIVLFGVATQTRQLTGTLIVHGSITGSSPFSFTVPVTAKVFDRATGTLYVGLDANGGEFALSKINRCASIPLKFSAIALTTATPPLTDSKINFLTLATKEGNPSPLLAVASASFIQQVFALTTDGETQQTSGTLNDAGGTVNSDGADTAGVVGLAASYNEIFAAVLPAGGGTFGDLDSGIAVVCINRDKSCPPKLVGLTQTAAQAGDMGIKAKRLDSTIDEIKITGDSDPTIIGSNPVVLYWDDPLQRLYTGFTITTIESAKAVVVGRVITNAMQTCTGTLEFSTIAADGAITPEPIPADLREIIVGDVSPVSTAFTLQVNQMKVMHASTGPSYLIINGGNQINGMENTSMNKIFALPLVDLRDNDGEVAPADEAIHGTLAKKDAPLTNFKFTIPAATPGDLPQDPTIAPAGTDYFALVGDSPLPIDPTNQPSDMVVVGDTVYVSFNIPQDNTNETGIIYSQALFDETGKIIGWTPWAKRAFPFIAFASCMNPCRVKFFDVDAVTGNIWAVAGDTGRTVAVNTWDQGSNCSACTANTDQVSLVKRLNKYFCCGCYSVLDLDAFTRGFSGATADRYALFGSNNKIAFTRISTSRDGTASLAPQTVYTDFSEPENFFLSTLPEHAGCVTSLEYSRQGTPVATLPVTFTDQPNYFFAGTQTGLYVFAQPNGSGFPQSSLTTLDLPPFSNGVWFKAENIVGSITSVKTIGNNLYVLASNSSKTEPLKSRLYSIPFAATVNSMFPVGTTPTIIAETNVGPSFASTAYFSAIQIISTSDQNDTEQVILATNNGLFGSHTVSGVQTAADQLAAAWSIISTTDGVFYTKIAGIDPFFNPTFAASAIQNPTTSWPTSIEDQRFLKTFDRSAIHQLNGTQDAGPFNFVPANFNALSDNPIFRTLLPTNHFWTDGARRFFIGRRPQDPASVNRLISFPYNVREWNIINPDQFTLLDDTLNTVSAFYWVKQIGASGILMTGTNHGVLGLE